jgi:hypothetical protein
MSVDNLVVFKKIHPLAKGLLCLVILKTICMWFFLHLSPAKKVEVTPNLVDRHLIQNHVVQTTAHTPKG